MNSTIYYISLIFGAFTAAVGASGFIDGTTTTGNNFTYIILGTAIFIAAYVHHHQIQITEGLRNLTRSGSANPADSASASGRSDASRDSNSGIDSSSEDAEYSTTTGKNDSDNNAVSLPSNTSPGAIADKHDLAEIKNAIHQDSPQSVNRSEFAFDDIVLKQRIGRGGNADIFQAVVSSSGRNSKIAVKVPNFPKNRTVNREEFNNFVQEAETWSKLDEHPNIVTVLDWGEQPYPWIAMEYMSSGSANDVNLNEKQRLGTVLRLAEVVEHAHRHGVTHGDLKPSNVLYADVADGLAMKVGDWGLARVLLDHSESLGGFTPTYSAPEQFGDVDKSARNFQLIDVYQLGAVSYELLTGTKPFDGPPAEVMNQIMCGEITPPSETHPELSSAIDEVILRAMATGPDDRFQSVVEFKNEFERILQ